jgi:hypothetical protein
MDMEFKLVRKRTTSISSFNMIYIKQHVEEHILIIYSTSLSTYLGLSPKSVKNTSKYVNQQDDVISFSICPEP